MTEITRTPPQDLEAEQAILGAMILAPQAIRAVLPIIQEQDFYRETNRKIFNAIVTINQKHEPVDVITLTNQLNKVGQFADVGGINTLTTLVDRVPTVANVEYYANIVVEKANLRGLSHLCMKVAQWAYDEDDSRKLKQEMIGELLKDRSTKKTLDPYKFAIETFDKYNDPKNPKVDYVPTGFENLDGVIKGIRIGAVGTVTGPFENGKSTFIQNVSVNLGRRRVPVLHIALEDTAENILNRQVCLMHEWDMDRLKSQDQVVLENSKKVQAFDNWAKLGIRLGDKKSVGKSWKTLKFIIMKEIIEHKVKVIFIEGGERMTITPLKDEGKYDAQERLVDELDDLAQEYGVGIWVIVGQAKMSHEKFANKNESEGGTAAWAKIARQRLFIERHPDRDKDARYQNISIVKVTKNSDGDKSSLNFEGNRNYKWVEV